MRRKQPCSICGEPQPTKPAVAYWAWFNAEGVRSAWKMFFCLDDALALLAEPLRKVAEMETEATEIACITCGCDVESDGDPVFLTLFLPKRDRADYELPLCGVCAALFRGPIVQHGLKLPNREQSAEADVAVAAWAKLGILPNAAA